MFFIVVPSFSQQQCGIYSTLSDYESGQLSISVDCNTGKKAIQISDFFLRPYIYIKTKDGRKKVHEDSVYAVIDSESRVCRIWKQNAYQIIDTGNINIYKQTYWGTEEIRTTRFIRHKKKLITDYFFSVTDSSGIFPLTLNNIRLIILVNQELNRKLTEAFPDNKSLQQNNNNNFSINDFLEKYR